MWLIFFGWLIGANLSGGCRTSSGFSQKIDLSQRQRSVPHAMYSQSCLFYLFIFSLTTLTLQMIGKHSFSCCIVQIRLLHAEGINSINSPLHPLLLLPDNMVDGGRGWQKRLTPKISVLIIELFSTIQARQIYGPSILLL